MDVDTPEMEKPAEGRTGSVNTAFKREEVPAMADEVKKEEKKENRAFSTFIKMALGLLFLIFGGWALYKGRHDLFIVIKGTIGIFFIFAGIITLAIAKE